MSQRVKYFYDHEVGSIYYGPGHPMKPLRMKMTHQLVLAYGLHKKMDIYEPHRASLNEMCLFHSEDYVKHLQRVSPSVYSGLARDNATDILKSKRNYSVGDSDCPIFPGCFTLAEIATGGSLDAAVMLNHKLADVCINWSGGLHHAKKEEASGFCFVNDIVCSIIELLKYHNRVLYIDIDVHHGDGVEEAFYTTNRVMTVSFHRFGEGFFPGTGDLMDIGCGEGRYFSLNVPLRPYINDDQFSDVFSTVMEKVREHYRPDVVVLQCGADSLSGDRLGTHNTTIKAHGSCVRLIKSWGLPTLLLGGGGYTIKNVARCWTYETALAVSTPHLDNNLPINDYYDFYGPDFQLHYNSGDVTSMNTKEYLDFVKTRCLQHLKQMEHMPSVGMFDYVPRDFFGLDSIEARQISKRAHAQEADIEDGMIEFQQSKKAAQQRSTAGKQSALGNHEVLLQHTEGRIGFLVDPEEDQFNDY